MAPIMSPAIAQAEEQAAARPVVAATLDWGIKASFWKYVTGPIPKGTIAHLGNASGTYHWPQGTGTACPAGTSTDVSFGQGNGVSFTGHFLEHHGQHALDLTFTNPRVVFTSETAGKLFMDIVGKAFAGAASIGESINADGVHLADISAAAPTTVGDVTTWVDASTTLTVAGAEAFGGFYDPGLVLDPLSLSVTHAPAPEPAPEPQGTSVSLSVDQEISVAGRELVATATVTPTDAPGSVTFSRAGAEVGSAPVVTGSATARIPAQPLGVHQLVATFVPADPAAFTGSTSNEATFTVVAAPQGTPTITVSRGATANTPAHPGTSVTVHLTHLEPGIRVRVELVNPASERSVLATTTADTLGAHALTWEVPQDAGLGEYRIEVVRDIADPGAALLAHAVHVAAVPTTQQTCSTISDASLTWGVRESFRKYVVGPIAKGSIGTSGSVTTAPSGEYTWKEGAGSVHPDGSHTNVAFGQDNAVRFAGHDLSGNKSYALDLILSNPRIELTSAGAATLFVDLRGFEYQGDTAVGPAFDTPNLALANLKLNAPSKEGNTRTWSQAAATLTEVGARAFGGFYQPGEGLDPVTFSVTAGTAKADCKKGPVDQGATGKPPVVPVVPGNPGITAPPVPTVPTTPGATDPGKTCVARAVTGGSLNWQLKESFRKYIAGPIANGAFSGGTLGVTGGALNTSGKVTGVVRTSGEITAKGHNGLLDMKISGVELRFTGSSSAMLSAVVHATNTSGKAIAGSGDRVNFATVDTSGLSVSGSSVSLQGAPTALTVEGAGAFAGFYQAGIALDPLSFTAELGGNVPCDDTTDPAKLANTGTSAPLNALGAAALLLVLVGAGLLRARTGRGLSVIG